MYLENIIGHYGEEENSLLIMRVADVYAELRMDLAIQYYINIINIYPDNAEAHEHLAQYYNNIGKEKGLIIYNYNQAIILYSSDDNIDSTIDTVYSLAYALGVDVDNDVIVDLCYGNFDDFMIDMNNLSSNTDAINSIINLLGAMCRCNNIWMNAAITYCRYSLYGTVNNNIREYVISKVSDMEYKYKTEWAITIIDLICKGEIPINNVNYIRDLLSWLAVESYESLIPFIFLFVYKTELCKQLARDFEELLDFTSFLNGRNMFDILENYVKRELDLDKYGLPAIINKYQVGVFMDGIMNEEKEVFDKVKGIYDKVYEYGWCNRHIVSPQNL